MELGKRRMTRGSLRHQSPRRGGRDDAERRGGEWNHGGGADTRGFERVGGIRHAEHSTEGVGAPLGWWWP